MSIRRLAILVTLLLTPHIARGADEPPESTLAVMTYNVRYGLADDGPNRWEKRRDLLTKAIADADPDVVGLQEALLFQINDIVAALPQYVALGVGRDDGEIRGEFSPLLVRTSRFLVAESGTFWLSETPEMPGSKAWDAALPRICTWARLIDRAGGGAIYVYNTHFDHRSQRAREKSAALILERIGARRYDNPAILLGDFNAGEDNPAIKILLGSTAPRAHLIDAYRAVHPAGADPNEAVGTFTNFDPANIHGPMIDHVFATPDLSAVGADIPRPRSPDGTRTASDHDPVTATFAWPPG